MSDAVATTTATKVREFERLTLNQRIQHGVLVFSFTLLVVTGFPVMFPEAFWSEKLIAMMGGFSMRGALHRFAAIILIGLSIYHAFYTVHSKHGRREFEKLMPNKKDLFDAIHMMKFYFGLAPDRAKFDRYNFIEKFEYIAVAWGSVIMIGTGLVLWYHNHAMSLLPKWAMDVAVVVHGYEALLAFLAIIIWHFYHVHFNPEVFPMSKIWLTGKITEHELAHHHPLEYERILEEEKPEDAGFESKTADVIPGGNVERSDG